MAPVRTLPNRFHLQPSGLPYEVVSVLRDIAKLHMKRSLLHVEEWTLQHQEWSRLDVELEWKPWLRTYWRRRQNIPDRVGKFNGHRLSVVE